MTDNSPSSSAPPDQPDDVSRWKIRLRSLARDFLLIVTGVLTALALENWNGALKERRLESEYLNALADDMRAQIAHYDRWQEALIRHTNWTATIWTWANGTAPQQPPAEVLLWLKLGGQIDLDTQFQDAAYEDLINSGKLSLISDRALREDLINYHNSRVRWNSVIGWNSEQAIERYTAAVADLIPPDVGWVAANNGDLATLDLEPVLVEFRRRTAVRQALVAMAESHRFRTDAAQRNRQHAAELLGKLESALTR